MKRQKMLVIVVSIIYMICSSSTILTNVYLNQLKKTNVVLHSGIVKTYGGLLNAEKFADSYELIINDPSISQNTTYLTISDLNITFTNETEINDIDRMASLLRKRVSMPEKSLERSWVLS